MLWSLIKHIKNRTSIFQYIHRPPARQGSLHRVPKMFLAQSSTWSLSLQLGSNLTTESSVSLSGSASNLALCGVKFCMLVPGLFVSQVFVPALPCGRWLGAYLRGLVCKAWFAVWRWSRLLRYRSVYIWGCDSPRLYKNSSLNKP